MLRITTSRLCIHTDMSAKRECSLGKFFIVRYTGCSIHNITEQCVSCFYVLPVHRLSHVLRRYNFPDSSPDIWVGDGGQDRDRYTKRRNCDRGIFIYLQITRYLLQIHTCIAVKFLVCFEALLPTIFS